MHCNQAFPGKQVEVGVLAHQEDAQRPVVATQCAPSEENMEQTSTGVTESAVTNAAPPEPLQGDRVLHTPAEGMSWATTRGKVGGTLTREGSERRLVSSWTT